MAKKVSAKFEAVLSKNPAKGGAWMATVAVVEEGIGSPSLIDGMAWSNASAGKRWIKEKVQELTPRKSIKMVAGEALDAKGKPTGFTGIVEFKKDA